MRENAIEAHVRVGLAVEDVVDLGPNDFYSSARARERTEKIDGLRCGIVGVLIIHHVVQIDVWVRRDHAVTVHLSNGIPDDFGTVDVRAAILVAELRHLDVVVVIRLHEGAGVGVNLFKIRDERVVYSSHSLHKETSSVRHKATEFGEKANVIVHVESIDDVILRLVLLSHRAVLGVQLHARNLRLLPARFPSFGPSDTR